MSEQLWPCWQCGNPGVRNIAANGYCAGHLHHLLATFDPSAFIDGGVGLQTGPLRPEYGPLEADLTCCRCGASWTGIPGDPCEWCRRSTEIMREMQADALLRPPGIDPDDANFERRMAAWIDRLVLAVKAELITIDQADAVLKRAMR